MAKTVSAKEGEAYIAMRRRELADAAKAPTAEDFDASTTHGIAENRADLEASQAALAVTHDQSGLPPEARDDAPRRCAGSKTFGIEPHDATRADFPVQPSRKDGLGVMCTPHWQQYVKALRERSKGAKATPTDAIDVAAAEASTPKPAKRPAADRARLTAKGEPDMRNVGRPRRGGVVDATETQKAEIADLERQLASAGGVETDAGQAILEAAGRRSAEMRAPARSVEAMEA